ncbi:MAG: class II aldolase/adducin family protein [Lysobacterales bacterium]
MSNDEAADEGVIQFDLDYTRAPLSSNDRLQSLFHFHQLLQRLGWLGREPNRYDGAAYGNVSSRCAQPSGFVISATQTGHLTLNAQRVCQVSGVDLEHNHVVASGPMKPSSEALTHAAVYALAPEVQWVFHIHEPTLWRQAEAIGMSQTDPDIGYGTPAMAREMGRLFPALENACGLVAMGGHIDGIISFANTASTAASQLFTAYCAAAEFQLNC